MAEPGNGRAGDLGGIGGGGVAKCLCPLSALARKARVGRGRAMHMRMVVGPGEPVGGLCIIAAVILWDRAYLSHSIAVPGILC